MEQFEIKNLNFSYPQTQIDALHDINLNIERGEFVLIIGKSGCGKTTLLRHFKPSATPKGKTEGQILFCNKSISDLDLREQSEKIGFVMQNPDNQIVTDKVWHELAFGMENLGCDTDTIRLRVAETASFFGIDRWFDMQTSKLSGGQKQLLNLAAVMTMNPQVLVLDEPTSQLDPIAAENFFSVLYKVNKELGVTIIITEHRLEQIYNQADRIVVMDNGRITDDLSPKCLAKKASQCSEFVRLSMPTAVAVYSKIGIGECPITVRDGRAWLSKICGEEKLVLPEKVKQYNENIEIEAKNVFFRYERNGSDILRDLSIKILKGTVTAIVGGNGAGKSTLLNVLSGISSPYSGTVTVKGKKIERYRGNELYNGLISVVPQNVQYLFTRETVEAELDEMKSERKSEIVELTSIKNILQSHPFDLSGGEQQRTAIAKVLLKNPQILFMDEPTKGMDAQSKKEFSNLICLLKNSGCTVVLISHDIEFCAKYADRCAMLFDGRIAAESDTRNFFSSNQFYTTAASRISKGIIDGAITREDVVICLKEKLHLH